MDLRHLRCFIAVAEELHFGRAADRVHLSQPAVSLQIRSLEQELGTRLFFRTKRRVSLTHAGTTFLSEARDLLAHTERVIENVRPLETQHPRSVIIGSTAPAIYCLAPAIVRSLSAFLPGTEIRISQLSTEEQEQALVVGKIHAGLVHPPMAEKGIQLLPLGSAAFNLVLPAQHKLASQADVSFADLREERLIMFPRTISPWVYDKIIGLCLKAGFTMRIDHETTPAQTIIGLVSAGQGIGLVIEPFRLLAPAGVVFRPIAGGLLKLDFAIATTDGLHHGFLKALHRMVASVDLQQHLGRLGVQL